MGIVALSLAIVNTFRYGDMMDEKNTRQTWLDAGLQMLAQQGPEHLRIMTIAAKMGVTKGSFYWHFKNLDEYHCALIEEWERCDTQQAIAFVDNMSGDAHAKLRCWITGASMSDFKLAKAIRIWSMSHSLVSEVQTRVDQQRTRYLCKLLREVGWQPEEADTLGNWTYWAFIGFSNQPDPSIDEKQLQLILAVLKPR